MNSIGQQAIPDHVSPQLFAAKMPQLPLVTSDALNWPDVTVQRYILSRGGFAVPPVTHWRLGIHMGGPLKVEASYGDRHHAQRWMEHGHFNFIPAMTDAHWEFLGKPDLLLVHLSMDLLNQTLAEIYPLDPNRVSMPGHLAASDNTVIQMSRLLLAETHSENTGTRLFADGLSRALSVHLLRHYSSLAETRDEAAPVRLAGRTGRVIDFIRTNFADDLSLDQLSKVGGIGSSTFGRAFRAETGLTPHRYLIKVRVEAACDLLERTRLPITDIGMRCGFGQPSHFSTMFRQMIGMTPREYRLARCT